MWLNFNVSKKLFLNDCLHGKGVFVVEDIHANEEVLQFGGPIVGVEELPKPYTAQNDYYLQIGATTFLGPSGKLDDYVNHSCNANTVVIFDSGVIKLVASIFIPAGNQITFDYSTTMDNFWWEMECACGSEKCRRKVRNFLDLSKQLQWKYINMGIVPEYILKKLTRKQLSISANCHAL